MASSDERVVISVWYLQALTTNTGMNSSGQEDTLSMRQGTGGCLAKESFSVQKLQSEASAVHVQLSRNTRRVPQGCGTPAGSSATTPA